MNIHAPTTLTPAEAALVDGFAQRVSEFSGDASVALGRDNAVEAIKAGLPTRRIEAWHYTDLRRLLNTVPSYDPAAKPAALTPLLEGSAILRVANGVGGALPSVDGVEIERFQDLLLAGDARAALVPADASDAVAAINAAFVTDGFALTVAAGEQVGKPIELQNLQAGGQVHARFPVAVGAGAKVTLIERQAGSGDALASSVTTLDVGEGADVLYIIVQEQGAGATQLGQMQISIAKDAKLTLFLMNIGGKLVRQEILVVAKGEGSDFKLRGVNLLGGDTHCDITMVVDHVVPHTTSTEIIRNVITDKAHGVFQGQIRVSRLAQKTDAKMACNTLLLSDDAEFSTKPELEIFADDVVCGHGATVTEIDKNHLFYLMARGVDEKVARGLLIKAFLAEIIEELESEELVAVLEAKLDDWFAKHA